jgi:threonine dehydratase
MLTLSDIESAADFVHKVVPPTPTHHWPLLSQRTAAEVWVKHENHTPIGAFKVRGGLTYMDALRREQPSVKGIVTATRGNHGQSVAFAARRNGLTATVVVPHGNSTEKNTAMRAFGAELIEHGRDFNEAYDHAATLASDRKLHMLRSFHPWLVRGVATYGYELFQTLPDIDTVYVPIGLGSGICGVMAARDALGRRTKVVGVVAENAATYSLSVAAGKPVPTNSSDTIADGMAVRIPDDAALALIRKGAERIVTISEAEIQAAMRHYFTDTHNVAEGAGAAALAGLLKEKSAMAGKRVALILSGGNVDRTIYRGVLAGN